MPKETEAKTDIFIANSIYPDAAAIFASVPKKLTDVKQDCIVVLDTNALFFPYSIGRESLKQINKTYNLLAKQDRLVVPGQVAREFAKNRAAKLVEIYQRIAQKQTSISNLQMGKYPLLEDVEEYQKSVKIEDNINKQLQEYRKALGNVLNHIQAWNWDDPVSLMYNEIFSVACVYDPSFDKEKISSELEQRYSHGIPPGYKDANKTDKGIGDFLIWKTILDLGKIRQKSVILVSNDEKNDWQHKSNNQVLYPRYELVDEFRRESDGHHFHIVQFSEFLNLYGASEKVVQEVKQRERMSVVFHIKSNRVNASMRQSGTGFLIIRGSQAVKDTSDSISSGWLELRNNLIESGALVDAGDFYEFSEDTHFSSVSAAASVILGRQAAGPLQWADDENRTYKEHTDMPLDI